MEHTIYNELITLPQTFPGLTCITKEQVYLLGCGSFEQFCSTFRGILFPDLYCPFCKVAKGTEDPLYSNDNWYLRKNNFPKPNAQMHLLIPVRHVLHPRELTKPEMFGFWDIFNWTVENYNLEGAGLLMRFGHPRYHSGSIPHLHANMIYPDFTKEHRPPLSKSEPERIQDYQRLLQHRNQLVECGGLDWLLSPE